MLAAVEPDIACLVESWATPEARQADLVGDRLGLEHRVFVGDWDQGGWTSGIGVVSRWPITQRERQALRGDDGDGNGEALLNVIDGPRGPVQLFVVTLDYPLHASGLRQAQVRQLAAFVARASHRRHPVVVCGDFNAGPDSDELRMLTGRSETPVAGTRLLRRLGTGRRRNPRLHVVQPQPACHTGPVPGSPVRLHPVRLAQSRRSRPSHALRTAGRHADTRAVPALGSLRRPRRPALLTRSHPGAVLRIEAVTGRGAPRSVGRLRDGSPPGRSGTLGAWRRTR